ncbi:MAG TPA: SatD family protein, partial [Nocardioides sp.]|nr:SatD family protein [Nocardioides sp.]
MSDMKVSPSVTVIGDLVGSRRSLDRAAVHERFEEAVAAINGAYDLEVPLRIGLGDEFQGIFASLGEAVAATLRLRLALLPDVDVRQGIGWGGVQVLSEEPRVEDGPGWWSARAAIDTLKGYERKAPL